jgi:Helix-turn-helix domain
MPRRTLTLTDAQRTELIAVRDHDRRPYRRERAAALLRIAAGESPHAVARQGILKPHAPDTLYAWLDRYAAQGIAGLIQRPRGHRGFSP